MAVRNTNAERELIEKIKDRYDIIGNDPKLNDAIDRAIKAAASDLRIFITGENGVGKDVFSKIIHDLSNRKHKRLIAVNCGAIPEGTIESELFGHKKGSFTGADKDRKGYFEEANDGTIFLDEVGELPLAMQVKLLRVLENHEILPVGESVPRKVNVRVVAATNANIQALIQSGHFRSDLFYRLNQVPIEIPPLRERKDDIPLLFLKFANDFADQQHVRPIRLAPDGKEYLKHYPWYGNIRELKNLTEQISVLEGGYHDDVVVTKELLRKYLNDVPDETMPILYPGLASAATFTERDLLLKALDLNRTINEMQSEINALKDAVTTILQTGIVTDTWPKNAKATHLPDTTSHIATLDTPHPQQSIVDNAVDETEFQETEEVHDDKALNMDEVTRDAIIRALEHAHGKRSAAAELLGISVRTLYRKLKDYNIE